MVQNFLYTVKGKNGYELDTNSIFDLYLPLIGCEAASLYMILNNNVSFSNKNTSLCFRSECLTQQLNCSIETIEKSRQSLEALGLITTYLKKDSDGLNYQFVLSKPLKFDEFILKPQYKCLLQKKIGMDNYNYLEFKYDLDEYFADGVNVSQTFENVFNEEDINNVEAVNFAKIYEELQRITSTPVIISDDCKQAISNIYSQHNLTLNDVTEIVFNALAEENGHKTCNYGFLMAGFQNMFKVFPTKTESSACILKRNFDLFKNLLDKKDELPIINEYKSCNSELYLSIIYKNNLTTENRKVLLTLKDDFHLKDEVINTLVDFSLFVTKGKLNKKYLFKAATTMNGMNISTSEQAITYLKDFILQNHKNKNSTKIEEETILESL